jgi:two-component system response regulator MprA
MAPNRLVKSKLSLNQVLIVEDAIDIQMLLGRVLESAGFSVSTASNGREALDLLQSSDTTPELIILDIMMPELDGYQFRKEQEKDPRLAEIPVVVMTAWADIESKAMQIGAKGYLKKPFVDIDTILSTVEKFVMVAH